MAKKKRVTSRKRKQTQRLTTKRKRITSQDGSTFKVLRYERKYKHAKIHKRAAKKVQLERFFTESVEKEYLDFFKRNRGKGNKFIFGLTTRHNLKGKRVYNGWSGRRVKLSSEKNLKKHLNRLRKKFLQAAEKYLHRKDMNSISISGVKMEVVQKNKKRA